MRFLKFIITLSITLHFTFYVLSAPYLNGEEHRFGRVSTWSTLQVPSQHWPGATEENRGKNPTGWLGGWIDPEPSNAGVVDHSKTCLRPLGS